MNADIPLLAVAESDLSSIPLLSVNLRREFGDLAVVSDVSFEIPPRAIVALVGPNGAGKTTWLKMVAGLLEPTSGTAKVFGIDVCEQPREVHERVGFLPDFFGLYEDLKAGEFLEYFARAYGIPPKERSKRIREILASVKLLDRLNEPIGVLSRGMHQRLGIAQTLISDPPLLLLDEPASRLDPEARHDLQILFQDLARGGKTLVVSSHILTELQEYCTHVAILDQGKLRMFGTVDEVQQKPQSGHKMKVRAVHGQTELVGLLRNHPSVANITEQSGFLTFNFDGDELGQSELLKHILAPGILVSFFGAAETSIQDTDLSVLKKGRP